MLGARSVAVVGASNDDRKVGYRPVRFLAEYGFEGAVYPVNPRLDECCGLKCYPSMASLPECPDLVVVVVNARAAVGVLEEAALLGVRSAVVMSSGFAELGEEGCALQSELTRVARAHGMLVCGPNSVGIVHTQTNLVATFSEALTRGGVLGGSLGVVSQSGAYGTVVLAETRARGLGIRTYVSTGNEAMVGLGSYLGALVEDPSVRVIGGYVEGISDAAAFVESMAAARAARKPVVLIKAGLSHHGVAAAASHTGALAGRDDVYEAAFRRLGVVRARTDAEFIDILEGFDTLRSLPVGNRVAVVTMSGGAGVLMSDLVDDVGLQMAELAEGTQKDLREILPQFASVVNPVDLTGQFVSNGDGLADVLRAVAADSNVDLLLVYGGLAWQTEDKWLEAVEEVAASGACVLAVRPLADAGIHGRFRSVGVPLYGSVSAAVRVAGALVAWGTTMAQLDAERPGRTAGEPPARWLRSLCQASGLLGGAEAKRVLEQVGLRTPAGSTAHSAAEASAIANQLGGNAVLKIDVPGLLHKSDIGGVELDVPVGSVEDVYMRLWGRAIEHGFDPEAIAVRVEEMITGGIEFIIGAVRAAPFGEMVGVGLGGTTSELLGDVAFELVPVTRQTAAEMISSLRGAVLLRGYRGGEVFDESALIEAVCRVSRLAQDLGGRLQELDCNPVLVRPRGQGAVVLDVALVLADAGKGPGAT